MVERECPACNAIYADGFDGPYCGYGCHQATEVERARIVAFVRSWKWYEHRGGAPDAYGVLADAIESCEHFSDLEGEAQKEPPTDMAEGSEIS